MPPSIDGTLAALSDPTRRKVVELLRERPRCPSELASALSMSRPATSRHLRVLRQSGLVAERVDKRDARLRRYELRRKPFTELATWVQEVEAFWDGQLAAFKAHAESRHRGVRDG